MNIPALIGLLAVASAMGYLSVYVARKEKYAHLSRAQRAFLSALRAVHWSIILLLCFYAALQPTQSPLLDMGYLALTTVVMFHWLLLKNECVLNYLDSKIVDCGYKLGADPYDSSFIRDLTGSGAIKIWWVLQCALYVLNFAVVLNRNAVGAWKYGAMAAVALYMGGIFFMGPR